MGYSVEDEASAYWIGKKTIELFSKESDGRIEKGPLYKEAVELVEMIRALLRNYRNEQIKVSYSGGVFNSGDLILNPLNNMLKTT